MLSNRLRRRLATTAAAALLLPACTGLGDIGDNLSGMFATKIPFKRQARSAEVGAMRTLAIMSDNLDASARIAGGLELAMNKLRVDERPHYTQVRMAPRMATPMTDAQWAETARRLGVEGLVVLTGASTDSKSASSTEDRTSCASASSKLFRSCPKNDVRTTKVACQTHTAQSAVRVRVVRSSDGQPVVNDAVAGSAQQKRCSDDNQPAVDSRQLVTDALLDAVDDVMRIIAPSYTMGPLELMKADAKLPASQEAGFKSAYEFGQAKRMDEACRRFDEIWLDHKDSPALAFNVAICHEVAGDLLKANQVLRRASDLFGGPQAQIDKHLLATEKALRDNPSVYLAAASTTSPGMSLPAAVAGDGRRVALVIGNARYQKSALANPVNDARLVGDRLKRIGFDVTQLEDLEYARLLAAVNDFAARAKGSDVALFYFAGHAMQVDGENFMLPVDNARIRALSDLHADAALQLAHLVGKLDAAKPAVKLVVIDACRDNPLGVQSLTNQRSLGGGGLAAVRQPPQGSLIAFATSPGRVAEDGNGRNSIYSRHFADQLTVPDQTLEQLFKNVRLAVARETGNKQQPMEVSSLVGDVFMLKARP